MRNFRSEQKAKPLWAAYTVFLLGNYGIVQRLPVLCTVIFSKCEIQFELNPEFHTYNSIRQSRDNVLNIRRD